MKTTQFVACIALLVLSVVLVRADIAKPKTTPEPNKSLYTSLEIIPDAKASEARLQVRQSTLNDLRAGLNGEPGNSALASTITRSSTRTIIAGLLMFLSVSFGGVWFVRAFRSGQGLRRTEKIAAIALVAVATLGVAAIITRGNAGPPPAYRWRSLPTALATGQSTAGGVLLEIVPDDPNSSIGMKLIIPLKKQKANGEEE